MTFEQALETVKPGVHVAVIQLAAGDHEVRWADGAYMRLRLGGTTVHVQELSNSSSGARPEGLYRALVRSKLPDLFRKRGIITLTCEPSDDDARARLNRYDLWEHHHSPHSHEVWVWWIGERSDQALRDALQLAHYVQRERETND
jgi:hypothetical protein